jgi:hypothetical protein
MPIYNDVEMNAILLKDFDQMVNEVIEELYVTLLANIQTEVYNAGNPQFYDRNHAGGKLPDSFLKEKAKTSFQTITGEINHDPDKLEHDPDEYIHGSNFWSFSDDVRPWIVEMIINGASGRKGNGAHVGSRFGPGFWMSERDFWTPLEELLTNGGVDKMFEKAMTNRGLNWKKV